MIDRASDKFAKQGKRIVMPFQHEMSQAPIAPCNRIRMRVEPTMCATDFYSFLRLTGPHERNDDAPIGKVWIQRKCLLELGDCSFVRAHERQHIAELRVRLRQERVELHSL